jgi:hypothetical protein
LKFGSLSILNSVGKVREMKRKRRKEIAHDKISFEKIEEMRWTAELKKLKNSKRVVARKNK